MSRSDIFKEAIKIVTEELNILSNMENSYIGVLDEKKKLIELLVSRYLDYKFMDGE